jgi:hypothetical protein
MPSTTTNDLRTMFLCRRSPARGTTTDASAVRLSTSRLTTHQYMPPAREPARDNN